LKVAHLGASVMAACVLCAPRTATAAEGDEEAIHVHYDAPPGCPTHDEFDALVAAMGAHFHEASAGAPARGFDIVVQQTGHLFIGNLVVRSVSGDERGRSVTCTRCESIAKALSIMVAMALESSDEFAAPVTPPPAAPAAPESDEPARDLLEPPDDSGGVVAMALWNQVSTEPAGAALEIVASPLGSTRMGVIAAFTKDDIADNEPTGGAVVAHGYSGRLGAVASWGAPFSRDVIGLALEAGVRAGRDSGTEWSSHAFNAWNSFLNTCEDAGSSLASYSCNGPGTPKRWRFASPYAGATFVLQAFPTWRVHPVFGLTALMGANYQSAFAWYGDLAMGLAWRW